MKKRALVRGLAGALIGIGGSLAPAIGRVQIAVPVFANSSCQSGTSSLFDGYIDTYSTWGASAWVVTRSSNWCTEPPSDPS